MKTNTLKLIIGTAAAIGLTLYAAGNLTVFSTSVSYLAVAILFALAALDKGPGSRSYTAR